MKGKKVQGKKILTSRTLIMILNIEIYRVSINDVLKYIY